MTRALASDNPVEGQRQKALSGAFRQGGPAYDGFTLEKVERNRDGGTAAVSIGIAGRLPDAYIETALAFERFIFIDFRAVMLSP